MAFEINWYVDQQVIHARYWGVQTEEELTAAIHKIIELVNSSPHEYVHRITDVSGLVTPLPLVKTIKIVRNHNLAYMPGWSITVGERNPVIKFIISGVRLVANQQMRSVNTFDDAIEFLKQADPSIQWDIVESN